MAGRGARIDIVQVHGKDDEMTYYKVGRREFEDLVNEGAAQIRQLAWERDQALSRVKALEAQIEEARVLLREARDVARRAQSAAKEAEPQAAQIAELREQVTRGLEDERLAVAEVQRLTTRNAQLEREVEVLTRSVERETERSDQRARSLRLQLDDAEAREAEYDRDLELAREREHELECRVAELEGLTKGWAPIVLGGPLVPQPPGEPEPTDPAAARKLALQGQAALARLGKRDLSPEARRRNLEAAARLGVLPEELRPELRRLEEGSNG